MRKEYIPYEKSVTVNQTTHEHRAPTDESVRLLSEMREKALDSIVKELVVEFGTVKATVLMMLAPDFTNVSLFNMRFMGKFNLNGKDHTFEGMLDTRTLRLPHDFTGMRNDAELILKAFHKTLSEAIAGYMMEESQEFLRNLVGVR